MPRFFIPESPRPGETEISVGGGDALHISKSLRMKKGDKIILARMGEEYHCYIKETSSERVVCEISEIKKALSEPSVRLSLFQAAPKGGKLENIIQKTTELGVSRVVPFISKRCVSRPGGKDEKTRRLRKIAEEAAKQSMRGVIPEISETLSFEEAVAEASEYDMKLICYENGGERLNALNFPAGGSIAVMTGAEGGFERDEAEYAVSRGMTPVWLGERILRCETCPVAVTAVIMNLTGNL